MPPEGAGNDYRRRSGMGEYKSDSHDLESSPRKRRRYDSGEDEELRNSFRGSQDKRGASRSPEGSGRRRRHRSGSRDRDVKHKESSRRDRRGDRRRSESPREREQDRATHKSSSRSHHRSHKRSRSRSRSPKRKRRSHSPSESSQIRSRQPLPSQAESFRGDGAQQSGDTEEPVEKEKPNYKPTGLLAAETNKITIGGGGGGKPQSTIVLKYHEPPEARKPASSDAWVMYIFKGSSSDPLQTIPLHTRSCWLLGREAAVADIPVEHPSCSKQHAVFQFRHVVKKDEWGEKKGKVGLYLLDLESANGTRLNGKAVEAARYVECRSGDVVKVGESEREYVILLPPKE